MRPNEIIKEIDNLCLAEKTVTVEAIWDSIARNNGELPMPEWKKEELNKRYSAYKNGKVQLHDWVSVHHELREKYK